MRHTNILTVLLNLLRGSKDMREMMLLSYYYGAEMGFLMTDSRIEEALSLAYEREKLLKKLREITPNS